MQRLVHAAAGPWRAHRDDAVARLAQPAQPLPAHMRGGLVVLAVPKRSYPAAPSGGTHRRPTSCMRAGPGREAGCAARAGQTSSRTPPSLGTGRRSICRPRPGNRAGAAGNGDQMDPGPVGGQVPAPGLESDGGGDRDGHGGPHPARRFTRAADQGRSKGWTAKRVPCAELVGVAVRKPGSVWARDANSA